MRQRCGQMCIRDSHYGVRLPIVVDNAESVTELLPVDSQVIRLVVSAEDESLRVEVDK